MLANLLVPTFVKFQTFSASALSLLPQNNLTEIGLSFASRVPLGTTAGFDSDVRDEMNPVILGFVYIMYALTLVFVILGIMKARSEDKQAAMWYLILAAIIGIAGLVVKNIFEKVADETQIDF